MNPPFDIVGIGAALVDTEIQVADEDLRQLDIDKGVMTLCDETTQQQYLQNLRKHIGNANRACGGSAANSMIALGSMNTKAFMFCKVAKDEDGDLFLSELTKAGLGYNRAEQQLEGTTGKCLVMITPDAERTMNTCLGISESLSPENLELDVLDQAKFVYIEGYLATSETGLAAAIDLRKAAQERDVSVALSLSDPGIVEYFRPQLKEILGSKVQMIFCNEAEALQWTNAQDLDTAANMLKNDCDQFAVTLGAMGALCWDGTTMTKISAPKVDAVNTNGAGDMFAGCALAALNQGYSLEQAAEFACIGAAEVVVQQGPRLASDQYAVLAKKLECD